MVESFVLSAIFGFASLYMYKNVLDWGSIVPVGSGFFMIVPIMFLSYLYQDNFIIIALVSVLIGFYLIDDISGLRVIVRIGLMILVALLLNVDSFGSPGVYFYDSMISFIFIFFILNVLNFQDGSDLNLAMWLLCCFGGSCFLVGDERAVIYLLAILGFLFSFSWFNSFRKNMFFGDSGVFLSVILIHSIVFFSPLEFSSAENDNVIIWVFLVLLYPAVDMLSVIIYRVLKKEALLSRNYYHTYQRLEINFSSRVYLLPGMFWIMCCVTLFNNQSILNLGYSIAGLGLIMAIFNLIMWNILAFRFGKNQAGTN